MNKDELFIKDKLIFFSYRLFQKTKQNIPPKNQKPKPKHPHTKNSLILCSYLQIYISKIFCFLIFK